MLKIEFTGGEFACNDWFTVYTLGLAIVYAMAGLISMLNVVMRTVIQWLSKFEAHHTLTERISSASAKMWIVQFVNSALVLLIINARYD